MSLRRPYFQIFNRLRILESAGNRKWFRQCSLKPGIARERHLAPYQFFHCLFRLYPRPAGMAPTRGGGNAHFHIQGVGHFQRIAESVLPLRCHIDQAVIYDLRRLQGGIEMMEATDTGTVHPFQVFTDTVLGNVAVHPVPPDHRPGFAGRIGKMGRQLFDAHLFSPGTCPEETGRRHNQ